MPDKFCKDCKHFRQDTKWYWFALILPFAIYWLRKDAIEFGKCDKFISDYDYLVSGNRKNSRKYASVVREFLCKGNAWESKNA